jgi:hypothetical protein
LLLIYKKTSIIRQWFLKHWMLNRGVPNKDVWQKKIETHFVNRVNTHEGRWCHSWQDHDPNLMESNQFCWMDEQWWNALHGVLSRHTSPFRIPTESIIVWSKVVYKEALTFHHPIKKIKDRCGDTNILHMWNKRG